MATTNTTPSVFTSLFSGTYAEFKASLSLPSINWVETKSVNSYFSLLDGKYYFISTSLLDRLTNETPFFVYSVESSDGTERILCFDVEYRKRNVRTI